MAVEVEDLRVTVLAQYDAEAKVWVATSTDVPGLVAEAESVEELWEVLTTLVPELLELNGVVPEGTFFGSTAGRTRVSFNLIASRHDALPLAS